MLFDMPEKEINKISLNDEQNENFNRVFLDYVQDIIENQNLLLQKGIFDTNITKPAAEINFLRSLYFNENYPRSSNFAFHPHILNIIAGSSDSLRTGLEKIVSGELKTERIRFIFGDKSNISSLYTCHIPFGTARAPADFPADLAKNIYNEYGNKGSVLDMCHGWGGRVVGFMLSDCKEYVGYDSSVNTNNGVIEIVDRFNKYVPEKQISLNCECFEKSKERENYYDLAFTSPPYFDVEKYDGEESSWKKYNNFELWKNKFYLVMIEKSHRQLKQDGYLILQVGNQHYKLGEIAKNYCDKLKMKFVDARYSGMSKLFNAKKEDDNGEMIYVFRKN